MSVLIFKFVNQSCEQLHEFIAMDILVIAMSHHTEPNRLWEAWGSVEVKQIIS